MNHGKFLMVMLAITMMIMLIMVITMMIMLEFLRWGKGVLM